MLLGARAQTLPNTMSAVEAKALVDTLADTVAGTKGRTPCNTSAYKG